MKIKFKWQLIDKQLGSGCEQYTNRAKVIGGWILHNFVQMIEDHDAAWITCSESMVFIPDPNHQWEIEEE